MCPSSLPEILQGLASLRKTLRDFVGVSLMLQPRGPGKVGSPIFAGLRSAPIQYKEGSLSGRKITRITVTQVPPPPTPAATGSV